MSKIGHNSQKVSVNSLTNEDKEKVKKLVLELNNSMTRVAGEQLYQKEAINDMAEKLGIDKRAIRRAARVYFKQNYVEEKAFDEEFSTFYEGVIAKKSP